MTDAEAEDAFILAQLAHSMGIDWRDPSTPDFFAELRREIGLAAAADLRCELRSHGFVVARHGQPWPQGVGASPLRAMGDLAEKEKT